MVACVSVCVCVVVVVVAVAVDLFSFSSLFEYRLNPSFEELKSSQSFFIFNAQPGVKVSSVGETRT